MPHPQNVEALAKATAKVRRARREYNKAVSLAREGQVTWRHTVALLHVLQNAQDDLVIVQRLVGEDK